MSTVLDKERPATQKQTGRGEFSADFGFMRNVLDEEGAKSFATKHPAATPKALTGDLVLEGYANTWVEDRDFEVILKDAFDGSLESYVKKNPIILHQHNHDQPLGQVFEAYTDATGLYVRAFVRKPEQGEESWKHSAYQDIKAGILRTMSIGGWFTREVVENIIAVTNVELFEISVVSVPSNPDSIFEAAVKSINDLPMTRKKAANVAAQLLGMEPISDPSIVKLPESAKRARYMRLSADLLEKGHVLPEYDAWRQVTTQAQAAKAKGVDAKRPFQDVMELAAKAESLAAQVYKGIDPDAVTKGAFTTTYEGWELQDTLWDAVWALRQALYEVLDTDGDGLPNTDVDPADIILTCNEFRDFVVRLMGGGSDSLAGMASDLKVLGAVLGEKDKKGQAE